MIAQTRCVRLERRRIRAARSATRESSPAGLERALQLLRINAPRQRPREFAGRQDAVGGIIQAMTLSISISPEAEARLKARAAVAGVGLAAYVGTLVEQAAKPPLSMEEISGPVADDFARSGMTEDEYGDLLEEVKHEMRVEKRARRAS